jgi:hypothetical protein
LPLWLYGVTAFVLSFGIWTAWTAAVYGAAWVVGGQRRGFAGFPHGMFSYIDALIMAAFSAAVWTGIEWWRRVRLPG